MKHEAITARDVLGLLATKHAEDVFVPECKDGATASRGGVHMRLDAWVMKRSWSHPLSIGYEIKVSRQDFLNDHKWTGYLPLCNEFYFVAPKGMIGQEELPPEAGLLEVVGTKRLATRKKAPHRDVPLDECLARYVLMCRCNITRDRSDWGDPARRADEWRAWLATKAENRKLGYSVSKAIREHVEMVEKRNRFLEEQNQTFGEVKAYLRQLGMDPEQCVWSWDVQRKTEEVRKAIPVTLTEKLYELTQDLEAFKGELDKLERKAA